MDEDREPEGGSISSSTTEQSDRGPTLPPGSIKTVAKLEQKLENLQSAVAGIRSVWDQVEETRADEEARNEASLEKILRLFSGRLAVLEAKQGTLQAGFTHQDCQQVVKDVTATLNLDDYAVKADLVDLIPALLIPATSL